MDRNILMDLWTKQALHVQGEGEEDKKRVDRLVEEGIAAFTVNNWPRVEQILRELGVLPTQAA